MQYIILVKSSQFRITHTAETNVSESTGQIKEGKDRSAGEQETEINDNVIWWHSWRELFPSGGLTIDQLRVEESEFCLDWL